MKHFLTHLPFAAWCRICLASKAKDDPHRQLHTEISSLPLVEVDYTFVSTYIPEDKTQVYLVASHVQSGGGLARVARAKGATDATMAPAVVEWLRSLGITGELRVRSDGEVAICSVVNAVATLRNTKTISESTPVKSPGSIGACDHLGQMIGGQIRALRLDLRQRLGIILPATHPAFGWMVRHAAFLLERFQPSRPRGNKTPYEIVYAKPYSQAITCFGAIGMGRSPEALTLPKAEPRWFDGVWYGRTYASGEHILSTAAGIRYCRSFRLLPEGSQRSEDFMRLALWSLWQQQPYDPEVVPGSSVTGSATASSRGDSSRILRRC